MLVMREPQLWDVAGNGHEQRSIQQALPAKDRVVRAANEAQPKCDHEDIGRRRGGPIDNRLTVDARRGAIGEEQARAHVPAGQMHAAPRQQSRGPEDATDHRSRGGKTGDWRLNTNPASDAITIFSIRYRRAWVRTDRQRPTMAERPEITSRSPKTLKRR
jgi:hypothetical protein